MIRRLLQRLFRIPSPSRQLIEAVRRGQAEAELEAEVDRYRRLLVGAAEAHGVELQPWQVDVAVKFHRDRLQLLRAANPSIGHQVKFGASFEGAKPERRGRA